MLTDDPTPSIAPVLLGCSKCGTTLPLDAEFCLKCGKRVGVPVDDPKKKSAPNGKAPQKPAAIQAKPKSNRVWIYLGIFVFLFLALTAWALVSDNPFAQGFQDLIGSKHDQTIIETDTPFTIQPHSFRYYKFDLPEGSTRVAIVGQFSASAAANKKQAATSEPPDNAIEVFVLSEPAFTVWQKGFATNSVYESGRVSSGTVQSDLPDGAGIYYLVFSNKASEKTAKQVTATVALRYKSWLPDWLRSGKHRLLD
ncbi:MAG TPA: zinc ribbon domain-containing protein [Terriglobales bacterium]|nr:zinc ribbon domain-containing protein [Terriglobales bacterium]